MKIALKQTVSLVLVFLLICGTSALATERPVDPGMRGQMEMRGTPISLHGYVKNKSGAGIDGATVSVGTQSATTGQDGRYTMNIVTNKRYTITVSKTGYQSVTVDAFYTDADLDRARRLGGDIGHKSFELYGAGNLQGKVYWDSFTSEAVSEASVKIGGKSRRTNNSGNYTINDLVAGQQYPITVEKPGYITYNGTVSISENTTQNISLKGAYAVTGQVRDRSGKVLKAYVTIFCRGGSKGTWTQSNQNEYYSMQLEPGSYTVWITWKNENNEEQIDRTNTFSITAASPLKIIQNFTVGR